LGRDGRDAGDKPVQVGRREGRHSGAADQPFGGQLGQGRPAGDIVTAVQSQQRPVDQERDDLIDAKVVSVCSTERRSRRGRDWVRELAGDEQLLSRNAGGRYGLAPAKLGA
jgi:hypothetical protein